MSALAQPVVDPLILAVSDLHPAERERLAELEQTIARGLAQFLEVGVALLEIRDARLYREHHGTFETYCRERWGFRRAHAYRLIQSARVAQTLSPMGDKGPASERQARQLAPLLGAPDELRAAWQEARDAAAIDGRPLSTGHLRAAVDGRLRRADPLVDELRGTDRWETPQELFLELDREFSFELDVCALPENAKCRNYYSPEDDGLSQPWKGTCWMNPPYNALGRWVAKAARSADEGATVVSLLPAATETGWWWDHCRDAEIRFLRGRIRFSDAATAAPFASAVVVFGRPAQVVWWEWRQPPRRGRR